MTSARHAKAVNRATGVVAVAVVTAVGAVVTAVAMELVTAIVMALVMPLGMAPAMVVVEANGQASAVVRHAAAHAATTRVAGVGAMVAASGRKLRRSVRCQKTVGLGPSHVPARRVRVVGHARRVMSGPRQRRQPWRPRRRTL